LYNFQEKSICLSKIAIFHTQLAFDAPVRGVLVRILS